MSEEIRFPDGRIEHPAIHTESTDASFRVIFGIILGAATFLVVLFVSVWYFFAGWRAHEDAVKKSPFPLAATPSTALPPEPRLEQLDRVAGVETNNVYLRQASREEILRRYGPTDEKGYVHIPLEQAMEILAARNLPARATPPADQGRRDSGLLDAGAPDSGRLFPTERQ